MYESAQPQCSNNAMLHIISYIGVFGQAVPIILFFFLFSQVQGSWKQHRHTTAHFSHVPSDSSTITKPPTSEPSLCPPSYGRGPASYRNRRYRSSSRVRTQKTHSQSTQVLQTSLPLLSEQGDLEGVQDDPEDVNTSWMGPRSRSTFSLPTENFGSACTSPSAPRPRSLSSLAAPVFRINVDALVGAEETDVDSGQVVSTSTLDLSVVSAYSRPHVRMYSQAHIPRPLSAPPHNGGPDFTTLSNSNKCSSLKRPPVLPRTSSISSRSTPCAVNQTLQKNACTSQDQAHEACNGTEITEFGKEGTEEDEQEFYI